MMGVDQIRSLLSMYKQDLMSLISSTSGAVAKKVLAHGTDSFLALLINLLYHISVGHVPINKKKYPRLAKSKRAGYLHRYFIHQIADSSPDFCLLVFT